MEYLRSDGSHREKEVGELSNWCVGLRYPSSGHRTGDVRSVKCPGGAFDKRPSGVTIVTRGLALFFPELLGQVLERRQGELVVGAPHG